MIAQRKIITVSSKRQITIPQKFYNSLGFENDAECELRDGGIFIKPIKAKTENVDFSTEILKDLISQGFSGEQLLLKFIEMKSKIRSSAEKLSEEAEKAVFDDSTKCKFEDLFSDD